MQLESVIYKNYIKFYTHTHTIYSLGRMRHTYMYDIVNVSVHSFKKIKNTLLNLWNDIQEND